MLKAYESGCSALKRVQDEHGLTLERAENVMDEVEQVCRVPIHSSMIDHPYSAVYVAHGR